MSIGIRDLARRASQVVEQVQSTGRPTLITRNGKPVAALIAIDESELEDWILSHAPEYVRNMQEADAEMAKGEQGRRLGQVLAELQLEETRAKPRRGA